MKKKQKTANKKIKPGTTQQISDSSLRQAQNVNISQDFINVNSIKNAQIRYPYNL